MCIRDRVGDVKDYNFTIVPITSNRLVDGVRVQKEKQGAQLEQKASVSITRNPNGSVKGRFTKITGDFVLTIRIR